MKKIICTVTNDLSYDQRMIRICTSLAKAGYQVLLIGRKKSTSITLKKRPFQQKRLNCWFEKGKLFYIEYNLRLLFFLLFARFDILNSVDLDTLLPGFIITRLRNKKLVYDAHEYFTEVPEVIRRPGIQRMWNALANFMLPKLQHAYTVGPALAQIMGEQYGIPFEVIRNVPYKKIPEKVLTDPNRSKIILYQGVLNEGRGLEYAIEAMQELDQVQLWLVGEGDLSQQLREQVRLMKLDDRVRFLGYQKPEDLPPITAQAFLGLNLLENKGLSYYYSLANKCFDYLQAGIPSLQMDFPEYRRLNEEYGVFVLLPQLTPGAIAHAIKQLLNDPEKYTLLKKNGALAGEELNWQKEEIKLLSIYGQL